MVGPVLCLRANAVDCQQLFGSNDSPDRLRELFPEFGSLLKRQDEPYVRTF